MVRVPSGLLTLRVRFLAVSTLAADGGSMSRRNLIPLLFLLLSTAVQAGSPAILVLGDSLSAGYGLTVEQTWPRLLQQALERRDLVYRVVNASISGDTTSGGLARLPRALKIHEPTVVIIELGGNDGLRAVPIPEIRANRCG